MTLRLWQKQGGYYAVLGWTGSPADVPTVNQSAMTSVPDKLSADGASESHAWLSLADHTADVVAETNELVQAFELSDKPEGVALSEAAPWHAQASALASLPPALDGAETRAVALRATGTDGPKKVPTVVPRGAVCLTSEASQLARDCTENGETKGTARRPENAKSP